jgi:hypothetical protein
MDFVVVSALFCAFFFLFFPVMFELFAKATLSPKRLKFGGHLLMYWTLMYCTGVGEAILRALLLGEKLVLYRESKFYLFIQIVDCVLHRLKCLNNYYFLNNFHLKRN